METQRKIINWAITALLVFAVIALETVFVYTQVYLNALPMLLKGYFIPAFFILAIFVIVSAVWIGCMALLVSKKNLLKKPKTKRKQK